MIHGYGGNIPEEQHQVSAETGRITLRGFSMQIDDDTVGPVISRVNGKPAIGAYFFGPKETPDGTHQNGITVTSYNNGATRFAEIPIEILHEAVPTMQPQLTNRLIQRIIQQADRLAAPVAPGQ
jgi:hypothetical protein